MTTKFTYARVADCRVGARAALFLSQCTETEMQNFCNRAKSLDEWNWSTITDYSNNQCLWAIVAEDDAIPRPLEVSADGTIGVWLIKQIPVDTVRFVRNTPSDAIRKYSGGLAQIDRKDLKPQSQRDLDDPWFRDQPCAVPYENMRQAYQREWAKQAEAGAKAAAVTSTTVTASHYVAVPAVAGATYSITFNAQCQISNWTVKSPEPSLDDVAGQTDRSTTLLAKQKASEAWSHELRLKIAASKAKEETPQVLVDLEYEPWE